MSDAIYVAAEAPAAFTLEVAGSASGPWTTAFSTETATNDGCGAVRPHKNEGVWSNAELQAAMASCDGQATTSPGCQDVVGWLDQRAWGTTMALNALNTTAPPHPLLAMAEAALAPLSARAPIPAEDASLKPVPKQAWAEPVKVLGRCGALPHRRCWDATLTFDDAGAVTGLKTAKGDYADKEHLLAETVVHVSSPSQRKAWAWGPSGYVSAASSLDT